MTDVISTKAHPGPWDGMEKAKPDEPVFTLIASDVHFEECIMRWVDLTRGDAMKIDDDDRRRAKLIQCTEAEMLAFEGTRWRKKGPREVHAPEVRATYSGLPVAPTEASVSLRLQLERVEENIKEADYHIKEALDLFTSTALVEGADSALLKGLQMAHELVHKLVYEVEPKRKR